MPIKILMPALSPTMTEGNLAKWVKKEGEKISAGEVIAEIETDKATMEVEAVDEGIIAKILIPEGTEGVQVNSLIAVLVEEDEQDADLEAFIAKFSTPQKPVEKIVEEKIGEPVEVKLASISAPSIPVQGISTNKRIFASPLAKRIADLEGISLANIVGSGPHGRIVKNDVLSAAKSSKGAIRRDNEEYRLVPNNNMRKVIAKRLLESKLTVPHFYLSIECVMDSVLNARTQINASFDSGKDKRLSVNDFIILACAKALKDVPTANASWTDSAIKLYNNVDISI
ncbi:MAG: pyruvate dehydrogenase complex dihydrolipoamide acetyltransferase, partial [Bacteroidia bacterium]